MSCGWSAPVVGRGGTAATAPGGGVVVIVGPAAGPVGPPGAGPVVEGPAVDGVEGRAVIGDWAPAAGAAPRACRFRVSTRVLSSSMRLESVARVSFRLSTWRLSVAT